MRSPETGFRYEPDLAGRSGGRSFHWRLPAGISARHELFAAFSEALWFPRDFGFDWDGLRDCLCDFEWMSDRKIELVHDRLPRLCEQELRLYLAVLRDAVRWWRFEDRHDLEVVFAESLKERIENLLAPPAEPLQP